MMPAREVLKAENAHLLGGGNGTPKVIIDRGANSTVVSVQPCPHGFREGRPVEFLHNPNGSGGSADRHALKLKLRLEHMAARVLARLANAKRNRGGVE